ncbi:unnamed protein product [Danaus chrysippus]|uniref:(African queen) hypothetical protein n=1 Tax=Danaus chrysippus TaxID=151541 RepID=A0A8J2VXN7_9NEOP|nr:unnamed protein product [Danaus chrysippus]
MPELRGGGLSVCRGQVKVADLVPMSLRGDKGNTYKSVLNPGAGNPGGAGSGIARDRKLNGTSRSRNWQSLVVLHVSLDDVPILPFSCSQLVVVGVSGYRLKIDRDSITGISIGGKEREEQLPRTR